MADLFPENVLSEFILIMHIAEPLLRSVLLAMFSRSVLRENVPYHRLLSG
jgi:hypothetical protein